MDAWFYALLGGLVGYLLFPLSIWLYKKYLSDTSILDFIKEQFKTMMKNRMDELFPTPPSLPPKKDVNTVKGEDSK